jgi:hypothetical protein
MCGTSNGHIYFFMEGYLQIGMIDLSKLYSMDCTIKDVILAPGKLSSVSVFTRVGTYVQRGSKFCFVVVVVLGVTVIAQNIAFLSNFTMHSAALLGSLARQPCPAALHCMRARQP